MASLYKTKLAKPRGNFLIDGEAKSFKEFASEQRKKLVLISSLVRKKVYTQEEMDKMIQSGKINVITYKNKPHVFVEELTTLRSQTRKFGGGQQTLFGFID